MADKIVTTTLVDVILKSGKVNSAEFNRQLESQLKQALANLPGVGATVHPKVKVDPSFDASKVSQQLRAILEDPRLQAGLSPKKFDALQKQVLKYASALESLGAVGSKLRGSKATTDFIDKISSGQAKFSDANAKLQRNVLQYRDSLAQLEKVYNDIARQFTKTRDFQPAPIAPDVKAQLDSLKNLAAARTRVINQTQRDIDNILSGKGVGDLGPLHTRLDEAIKERSGFREQYQQVRQQAGPSTVNIGALIDPSVERTRVEISNLRGTLDSAIKETEKAATKQKDLAVKQRQAAEAVDKLLPALGQGRGAVQKALQGSSLSDLAGIRAAIREESKALRVAGAEGGGRFSDLRVVDRKIAELERRLLRQETAAERRLSTQDRLAERLNSDLFKGKAQYREIPLDVRRAVRTGEFKDVSAEALKAGAEGYQRQLNLIRDRVKQNDKVFTELTDRQKQWIESITKALKEGQRKVREELRGRTRPEIDPRRQFNIQYGREAFAAAGGRLQDIPKAAIPQVQDYIRDKQDRLSRYVAGLDTALPGNKAKIDAGIQQLGKYREQLTELGHAAAYTHPLLTQVGRTLIQFTKYAIGYAALYKITQGLQSLGAAAVSLEDNLKQIQAVTGSFNSDIIVLNESIKKTAVSTAFSLDEIAGAVQTIAQSGTALKDIPATVQAVADLATATGSSLQTAADVITTAQHVWDNLDAQTIADRVTQAVNVSKLAVQDLQTIFSLGASFAESSNVSLDQLLGQVSVLANRGVRRSTIGTGLSQLYQELFSPDQKFAKFLSRQYGKIGENVTPGQAAGRFAAFREGRDPMLEALQELKRLGVDQVGSLNELSRAIDKRAFNILRPAAKGVDDLPFETARAKYAPTAAEGAKTALDSLGKAAKNLGDTIEAASATALTPFFGGLTEATKSLSEFISTLDRISQSGSDVPGADAAATRASITTAILAGFELARRTPGNIYTKGLGFAVGALGGGTAGHYASKGLTSATGSTVPSDILTALLSFGIFKTSAPKFPGSLGAFRANPAGTAAAGTATAAAAASATTEAGSAAAASVTLGSKLKVFASNFKLVNLSLRNIAGYLALGTSVGGGLSELFSKSDGTPVKALIRQRAQAEQDRQKSLQGIKTYLPQPAGVAETDATKFGAQFLLEEGLANFKKQLEAALQVTIEDEFKALDLVEAIRRESTPAGRERLVEELKKQTGSTVDKISQDLMAELLAVSGALAGQLSGSGQTLSDLSKRLSELERPLEDDEIIFKKALDELAAESASYASVISGFNTNNRDIIAANRAFIKKIQERGKEIADDLRAHVRGVEEFINVLRTTSPDQAEYRQAQDQLRGIVQDGFRTFGLRFSQHAQTIVAQMISAALDNAPTVQDGGVYRTVTTPEQRELGKAQIEFLKKQKQDQVDKLRKDLQNVQEELKPTLDLPVKTSLQKSQKDVASKTIDEVSSVLAELPKTVHGIYVDSEQEAIKKATSIHDRLVREGKIQPDTEFGLAPGRANADIVARRRKLLTEQSALDAEKAAGGSGGGGPTRQDFVGGAEYNRLNNRLEDLNTAIEELSQTNLAKLVDFSKPSENLLNQRRDVQLELLDRRIAFERKQPNTKDGAREANLEAMERERQKLLQDYERDINKYKNDLAARVAKADLRTIDAELGALNKALDAASSLGDFEAVAQLQTQIEETLKKRLDAEERHLAATVKAGDQLNDELAQRRQAANEQLKDVKSIQTVIRTGQSAIQNAEQVPLYGDYARQAALEVSGEAPGIDAQTQRLVEQIRLIGAAYDEFSPKLREAQSELDKLTAAHKENTPEYSIAKGNLIALSQQSNQFNETLGRLHQTLVETNPTLASEIGSISGESIGAQIADLPQSLRNLNTNLEGRVVDAVDGLATALSDEFTSLIEDMLGLSDATQKAQAEFQALGDAQARLADVTQSGLDVAEQISSIRQNETDPKRQEYLIRRAEQAQRQAEELARLQVESAQAQYDEALNKESFGGKVSGIFSEMFGGIAQDLIKGTILGGFSSLFGGLGGIGGQGPKGSYIDPIYTVDKNAGLLGGNIPGIGGGDTGSGGGFGDFFSELFGGVGNFFGDVGSLFGFTNSTREAANAASALSPSSGGGGFFEGLSSTFSNLFSGFGGLFGGSNAAAAASTSAYGVPGVSGGIFSGLGGGAKAGGLGAMPFLGLLSGLLGIGGTLWNYFSSKSAPQQYIIQSHGGYAEGGFIKGKGTTTSDENLIFASDKEYVLNAKTTAAIGKDVLDSWNFGNKYPGRFASGGMVESSRRAVSSRADPPTQQRIQIDPLEKAQFRFIFVDDERDADKYLNSPRGTKSMLHFVRRNSLSMRQEMGV